MVIAVVVITVYRERRYRTHIYDLSIGNAINQEIFTSNEEYGTAIKKFKEFLKTYQPPATKKEETR